jgi:hypothetical protein
MAVDFGADRVLNVDRAAIIHRTRCAPFARVDRMPYLAG